MLQEITLNKMNNNITIAVGISVSHSVRNSIKDAIKGDVWRALEDSLDEFMMDFISWPEPVKNAIWDLIWYTAHSSIERSIRDATRVYFYFEQNEQ